MDGLPTKEEIERLIKDGVIKPQVSNQEVICDKEVCCGSTDCSCKSKTINPESKIIEEPENDEDNEFDDKESEDEFDDKESEDIGFDEADELEEFGPDPNDVANIKNGVITKHCTGCSKIKDDLCTVYANPEVMMRWVEGKSINGCGFNRINLVKQDDKKSKEKVRIGQQKQKSKSKK